MRTTRTAVWASVVSIGGVASGQVPGVTLSYGVPVRMTLEQTNHGREFETAIAANALDRVVALSISGTPTTLAPKTTQGGLFRLGGAERIPPMLDLRAENLTFTGLTPPPPPGSPATLPVQSVFDPVACTDLAGNLWIAACAWHSDSRGDEPNASGVFYKSAPAGGTFGAPQWIVTEPVWDNEQPYWLIDKPAITAGRGPGSTSDQAVYFAWTRFKFQFDQILQTHSTVDAELRTNRLIDGAVTPQAIVAVFEDRPEPQQDYYPIAASMVIDPASGRLVLAYTNSLTLSEVRTRTSDDGAATWSAADPIDGTPSDRFILDPILPTISGQKNCPVLAVDPRARAGGVPNLLYCAYVQEATPVSGNPIRTGIRIARSSTGGRPVSSTPAWNEHFWVPSPPGGGDLFMPSLAVDALGGLHVTYLYTVSGEFRWYHTMIQWPEGGAAIATAPVEISTNPTFVTDLTPGTVNFASWAEYHLSAARGQSVFVTWCEVVPSATGPNKMRAFFRKIDVYVPQVGGGPD